MDRIVTLAGIALCLALAYQTLPEGARGEVAHLGKRGAANMRNALEMPRSILRDFTAHGAGARFDVELPPEVEALQERAAEAAYDLMQ